MCGIFGTINVNPIDEKKFDRSVELLRHRGPDDKGIRVWGDVAFGFMRLAIQDLSDTGRQPMSHSQKPIHIILQK